MSRRWLEMNDQVYRYLLEASSREPRVLRELRAETASIAGAGMQIAPDQGQFMALLARLIGARHCLEIGVYTGYSSLSVALALPDDGRMIACDISEEWTTVARRYWARAGVAGKIDLRLAPALQTLDGLLADGQAGRFDFAFIDADKEGYRAYYERVLRLLRPGGLACVDNTLWSGRLADPAVRDTDSDALREFNAFLRDDPRVDLAMLTVGDGLTLLRKKAKGETP